tara:strand:- start:125 stop:1603 length:1479 start_codon:yes stop_codon:yes gene_type:complete
MKRRRNGRYIPRDKTLLSGFNRVTLANDILIREKLPGVWRYDVIAINHCGKGKFGSVYEVLAVLKHVETDNHNQSRLRLDIKSKRVYKIQNNAAWHEFKLMKSCSHLGARGLFPGIPSLISMRKFNGEVLNDALNSERKDNPLTIADRYRLSISLLKALQLQIHDQQICHKDIKPDNIYYHRSDRKVFIFDLGISKQIDDHSDLRSRGNAVFSAPEEFTSVRTNHPVTIDEYGAYVSMKSETTVKSDIYSMARVIGLVWRDRDPVFSDQSDLKNVMRRRITDGWVANFRLFYGIEGLLLEERSNICAQLQVMTQLNPADRPDLQACIDCFQRLYLNFKLRSLPLSVQDSVSVANQQAQDLLQQLRRVESFTDLYSSIRHSIHFVPDNKYAMAEYIETLGVECFAGLISKGELLELLKSIETSFQDKMDTLSQLHDHYERVENKTTLLELDYLLASIQQSTLTLDNVLRHINHIDRKLEKIYGVADLSVTCAI